MERLRQTDALPVAFTASFSRRPGSPSPPDAMSNSALTSSTEGLSILDALTRSPYVKKRTE